MSARSVALLGVLVLLLAGCGFGSGPKAITGEFEGRDCELYTVAGNWLVYAWSPPVPSSRPIHLVVRDLSTGVETELEPDWYAPGPIADNGLLVYAKPAGGGDRNIVVYDLQAQTRETLYTGKVSDLAFSGSTVAWQTLNGDGSRVIALMPVRGGSLRLIEDAARPEQGVDSAPRISGSRLVFLRRDLSTSEYTIMLHDVSVGTTEALLMAVPSSPSFDLSEGRLVYIKKGEDVIYLMDLDTRVERALVEVPRRTEGPVIRGNIVAWTSHMRAEDFKGIGGRPLIDERDFRTLHALNVDTGKSITPIRDRYMLGRVRISDDRQIYALVPREITTSPGEIKDVVRF